MNNTYYSNQNSQITNSYSELISLHKDKIISKSKYDENYCISRPHKNFPTYDINDHIFFMTFHIHLHRALLLDKAQEKTFRLFDEFLERFDTSLLGPNHKTYLRFKPLISLFFDVESSRSGKILRQTSVPHLHGVMLLHPETLTKFHNINFTQTIRDEKLYSVWKCPVPQVDEVSLRPIKLNNLNEFDGILSYNGKATKHMTSLQDNYQTDAIYPLDEQYPFHQFLRKRGKADSN